ncbi:MAG TPA: site-specific integrase [Acidimicrobiia bacterium]|nr:site-specific integrase [Acidimicrobiia bacterium]
MIRARRAKDGSTTYQLVVYAGRNARGGDEYVRRTLRGVSRREATRVHAQLTLDVQEGRTGPSRSLTVRQLSEEWWETHARELSPSTRIGYRHWLDSRVLPHFGRKRISTVSTADVEKWLGQLRDGPHPLGIRSIRACRTVLSAMFTAAVRWGYLPSSPVLRARVPQAPKWTPRAPEPELVATRLAAAEARDPDLGVFARMAIVLGARRGELAALRWTDIDFTAGLVHIRHAIVSDDETLSGRRRGARLVTKDTKTHSERAIAIDPTTMNALRNMRSRHVEAALACGVGYPTDAYVWPGNVEGTRPRPPDRFTYDWVCVDKAVDDGAHVRLHDLRHFHGTMLVGAGVPLPSVRDRLGHSSVTVTDIYVDGRSEWDQRSAEIMGAILDSGTLSGPSR